MRVAIVQLSDIHFQVNSNILVSRSDKIIAAIQPTLQQVQGLAFAVTGDVAYSGSAREYEIAAGFFARLRDAIRKTYPDLPVVFVFIPGNHDCNFGSDGEVRSALLDGLAEKIATLDPAGEIARKVTEVQDNFFTFESRFNEGDEIPKPERLRYQTKMQLGSVAITFDCYNTAWMSRKIEREGTLLFPPRLLASDGVGEEEGASLTISLLHHRDNWLEASHARLLRDHIDISSDIVLTGHEHVSSVYKKTKPDGAGAQYIEGAVLQDSKSPGNSGFNVLELDLEQGLRVLPFRWSGQRYSCESDGGWSEFAHNRARGAFQISAPFLRFLSDPGTGFVHPSKPDLALDDLFVYPDLVRKSLKKIVKSGATIRVVLGRDVAEFVADSKHVIVSGPDDSGRSSLAHTLYLDLRRHGRLVPVLLNGEDVHGRSAEAALRRAVERALGDQYCGDVVERYAQMDPTRKLLIVDDWHKLKYGERGQRLLLEQAEKCFGNVLCFSDEVFALDQLAGGGEKPFRDYEICEIRELGHLRRNELIRKWYSLGSDYSETEADLAHSISAVETTVNTLLGKNLLPSYPVIILAILQSYAAGRGSSSSAGSYGQMYEALITAALASVSKKAVELGTKYTYISRIAYYSFHSKKKELEAVDLEAIHSGYYEQYKISLGLNDLIDQLVKAQILSRANGSVQFKYKYIYCYFVAKYFQDNIANLTGEGDLRAQLQDIADKVYFEDYANIIIFYVYLTKDRAFIEYLLANANRIYREHHPCDLSSHVEFVNRLGADGRSLVLPGTNVEQNREEALRRKDEAEEEIQAVEEKHAEAIKYEDGLAEVVKIHIALKSLRILGQILRNFPGALRADLKVDLALASYQLGLRTLRAVLLSAENNIDELRTFIARVIQERRILEDPEDLASETDKVLLSLTRDVAFGMVKRISQAVGLEELEETYREALERAGAPLPVKVVDYAIKLDHFARFPKAELERITEELKKNPFALRLVRDLTADYMYLFPVDFRARQYIGDTLNLKVNIPNVLGSGSKRLKALPAKTR